MMGPETALQIERMQSKFTRTVQRARICLPTDQLQHLIALVDRFDAIVADDSEIDENELESIATEYEAFAEELLACELVRPILWVSFVGAVTITKTVSHVETKTESKWRISWSTC